MSSVELGVLLQLSKYKSFDPIYLFFFFHLLLLLPAMECRVHPPEIVTRTAIQNLSVCNQSEDWSSENRRTKLVGIKFCTARPICSGAQ